MTKEKKVQLNQSLIDGIATLQELALSSEPIGCRELARRLDMEPTRVNRLLQTLDHIGIARKTVKRKYTSGSGMHVLSAQALFASGLLNAAIKPLESLQKYGFIVALGMLWRDHVSYLYHAEPGMDSTAALGRLGLYPASKGGVGIALLAQLTDDVITQLYENREIEGHEDGIASLLQIVNQTREKGYSYLQTDTDTFTLAVPVGHPAFCAIALSGWISKSSVEELIPRLQDVAKTINESMH